MTPLELRAFACGSGDRGTARYSVAFHGETTSGAGAFKLIGQRVFGIACGHPDGRASTRRAIRSWDAAGSTSASSSSTTW